MPEQKSSNANGIFIFLAGAIFGGGLTYFTLHSKMEAMYEERIQQDVASINETKAAMAEKNMNKPDILEYHEYAETYMAESMPQPEAIVEEVKASIERSMKEISETIEEPVVESEVTDIPTEEELEEAEIEKTVKEKKGGAKGLNPYVITEDDYADLLSGYDKETLMYYSDGVLASESYDEIMDIRETIGTGLVSKIPRDKSHALYVRNEWLGTEYEVYRCPMTYKDASGMEPMYR